MRTLRAGICDGAGTGPREGFSLLELIVVLFLLSLLAALVFPSFTMNPDSDMKTDAGKVASLLRYLNDRAIATKDTDVLKFDLAGHRVLWNDSGSEKAQVLKTLAGVYLPSRGELVDGQAVISFGALGAPENIAVRLREGKDGMTVLLSQLSGRTKIIQNEK